MGFTAAEAGAIGIIGGADGPTAIFLTSKLAPDLLGAISISAYSYMALVPVIQPPVMRLFTTKKERLIRMMEFFNISYKSYAEEYEEFVTMKMKHKGRWDGGKRNSRGKKDY